jgi:hypothetical protein
MRREQGLEEAAMHDVLKPLRIRAALAGTMMVLAPAAEAQQYCHNEWSPEKGDHQVCEFSPDPRYQTKCHWEWNARQGDHRVCQQSD